MQVGIDVTYNNMHTDFAISPCPKREIWPFLKGSHISETIETTRPPKISVHVHDINPCLHKFFEPILIGLIFPLLWNKS